MIWPLTSLSAGHLLIIGLVLAFYVAKNVFSSIQSEMENVSDMTLMKAITSFNFSEVKNIIFGTVSAVKKVGTKAIGPIVALCVVFFYMLLKMFLCSCGCNNCP